MQNGSACARQNARLHFVQLADVEDPVGARVAERGVRDRERIERERSRGAEWRTRVMRECRADLEFEFGFVLELEEEDEEEESLSLGDSELGFVEGGLRGIMPD